MGRTIVPRPNKNYLEKIKIKKLKLKKKIKN